MKEARGVRSAGFFSFQVSDFDQPIAGAVSAAARVFRFTWATGVATSGVSASISATFTGRPVRHDS